MTTHLPPEAVEAVRLEIGRWTRDYREVTARDALTAALPFLSSARTPRTLPPRDDLYRAWWAAYTASIRNRPGSHPTTSAEAATAAAAGWDAVRAALTGEPEGRTEVQVQPGEGERIALAIEAERDDRTAHKDDMPLSPDEARGWFLGMEFAARIARGHYWPSDHTGPGEV